MGISRFYRWVSERYPQINEEISDEGVLSFDNLYLDVNGIAHNSVNSKEMSTPNLGLNLTEKGSPEIWASIFKYISRLVKIVKPRKLLYIAIDGVAPRAKMNQQRSRRFRSARDADVLKEMERKNLIDVKDKNNFDSNCITPGTTFMCELKRQLEFFISYQIQNESSWRNLEIILSGADVPGEGEHKIMDYIRCIKSQPDYNPNTRHCLYGLDADLIMLSLASHEPHFSLLREEVKFYTPRNFENRSILTKEKFQFLHISLLREYIINDLNPRNLNEKEIKECFEDNKAPSDICRSELLDLTLYNQRLNSSNVCNERLIDDFIILGFIVGNDFLPHIPFHTVDQGFSRIIVSYKKYLAHFFLSDIKGTPWLLEDCGRINFCNFLRFLVWHIRSEREESEKRLLNPNYWRSVIPDSNKICSELLGIPKFMKSESVEEDKLRMKWQYTVPENFDVMRWRYYYVKMSINLKKFLPYDFKSSLELGVTAEEDIESGIVKPKTIEDIVFCYLEGLQWVSYYYFRGVPSWRWYYPYRYAPFAYDIVVVLGNWLQKKEVSLLSRSDIVRLTSSKLMSTNFMYSDEINLSEFAFKFVKGIPLQPFEQLMGVLPSRSMNLLPEPFRRLFTSQSSPLVGYYPTDFEIDMEGVKVPWGGVTLIPFIDESILIKAINYVFSKDGFLDLDFNNFKFSVSNNLLDIKDRYCFLIYSNKYLELIDNCKIVPTSNINNLEYLSQEDLERNLIGEPLIFYYDTLNTNLQIKSTLPTYLSSINNSNVASKTFSHPCFPEGILHFPNYLLEDIKVPYFRFPSFNRLSFKIFYDSGVNIFGFESNQESLFISLSDNHITLNFLSKLVNSAKITSKSANPMLIVDYPRAHIAELVSIKTPKFIFKPNLITKPSIVINNNTKDFVRTLSIEHALLKKRGIVIENFDSKIDVDEILKSIGSEFTKEDNFLRSEFNENSADISTPENCLVEVKMLEYSFFNEGEISYKFSNNTRHFLLPTIMLFSERDFLKENNSEFRKVNKGDKILCIDKNSEYYGLIGTISFDTKIIAENSAVFLVPKSKVKVKRLQKRTLEYALEDLNSVQWFSFEDVNKIIFKPFISCLKETGGLDDLTSLKYMKYSMLVLQKILVGPVLVKLNDGSLHDISMMLYNEDKQKTKLCLPLFSKFADKDLFETSAKSIISVGTPVVSNEAVKALIEYINLFPNFVFAIFNYLYDPNISEHILKKESCIDNSTVFEPKSEINGSFEGMIFMNNNRKINVREIFTDIQEFKDQDFKFNSLMNILKKKIYRNMKFLNQKNNSISMSPSTILRLEKLIQNSKFEFKEKEVHLSDFPLKSRDFFLLEFESNSFLNRLTSKYGFPLGTRVIYIKGTRGIVPFGTMGTVISVYTGIKTNKEIYTLLDILLDDTHINACNLNGKCSNLRGITIPSLDCIPLLPYLSQLSTKDSFNAIKSSLLCIEKDISKLELKCFNTNVTSSSMKAKFWEEKECGSNNSKDNFNKVFSNVKNKTHKKNPKINFYEMETQNNKKFNENFQLSVSKNSFKDNNYAPNMQAQRIKNQCSKMSGKHFLGAKDKSNGDGFDTGKTYKIPDLMELEIKKLLKIS